MRRLHAGAQRLMPHDAAPEIGDTACTQSSFVRSVLLALDAARLARAGGGELSEPGVNGILFRGRIRRVTTPKPLVTTPSCAALHLPCSEYPTVDFRARTLADPPGPAFDALNRLCGGTQGLCGKRIYFKDCSAPTSPSHIIFPPLHPPSNLTLTLSTTRAQLKTRPRKAPLQLAAQQW